MLGIGGKFASSKGMVAVPSLSGLSQSSAESALTAAGLTVGSVTTTGGTSSNNGTVSSQGIASGTLVDYETPISFIVYTYTAPSGPYVTGSEQISATCAYTQSGNVNSYCNGTTKVTTYTVYTYTQYRYYWSDGSTTTGLSYCGANPGSYETSNSPDCGYVAPPPPPTNCTSCVSSYNVSISTSACASGRAWYSVCIHADGCSPAESNTPYNCVPLSQIPEPEPCACTAGCAPVWYGSCGGTIAGERLAAQRCTDCDCNQDVTRWSEPC